MSEDYKKSIDNNGVVRERPEFWEYPNVSAGDLVRLMSKGDQLGLPKFPAKKISAEGEFSDTDIIYEIQHEDILTIIENREASDGSPISKVMNAENQAGWVYTAVLQPSNDWYIPLNEDGTVKQFAEE